MHAISSCLLILNLSSLSICYAPQIKNKDGINGKMFADIFIVIGIIRI